MHKSSWFFEFKIFFWKVSDTEASPEVTFQCKWSETFEINKKPGVWMANVAWNAFLFLIFCPDQSRCFSIFFVHNLGECFILNFCYTGGVTCLRLRHFYDVLCSVMYRVIYQSWWNSDVVTFVLIVYSIEVLHQPLVTSISRKVLNI